MTLRIRQIVFVARDLASTVAQFEQHLRIQVAFRDPLVAEFGLQNAVLPIGDQFLEVVSPTRDDTAAGRHLERHGDSAYMLILQTDDLERDRARLDRLGVRRIWEANHSDIRASQLHPKDIGGAIVSLDQPTPPQAWRWAGPEWTNYVTTDGARTIREVTIGARDPAALARRWAEVLDTETPRDNCIAISSGSLNFVAAEADRIVEYRFDLARPQAARTVSICGTRFVA